MIKKKTRTKKVKQKTKQLIHKGGKHGFLSGIAKSLVQVRHNDYEVHVPGAGLFTALNPKHLATFTKTDKPKPLSIIFNYKTPNAIDLADISDNTELSSNAIVREPYVFIDSMGKYIIAMYRIIYNKPQSPLQSQLLYKLQSRYPSQYLPQEKPKILLHWLVGFNDRMQKKIYSYIAPHVKLGKTHNFIVEIFKYPENNNNKLDPNFVKINNIDNKAKAYEEFKVYMYISKIISVKKINFRIKGDIEGIDIFNMLNKTRSLKLQQKQAQSYWKSSKA